MYNSIEKVQVVYMGFLNYNKIFDINILNLETDCSKIHDDFDHVSDVSFHWYRTNVNVEAWSIYF
jgi:hypothetical protein